MRWKKEGRKIEPEALRNREAGGVGGGGDREGRKGGKDRRQRGMAVYLSSQIN